MVSNWLVTGGCGFIGSALVARLVAGGDRVRIVDNLTVGQVADLPVPAVKRAAGALDWTRGEVELVVGDVRDAGLAAAAARGADVIVHLAANTGVMPSIEDPRADCDTNVFGTLNYLEAARANKVARFVFASSGAPVGNVTPPIHEELAPHPMSPYGASKLAGEGYCSAYFHAFGIETVALRFGNAYGIGSHHKGSVVARFIRRALAGQPLEIYGDGNQTRDFIFIDDIVEGMLAAGRAPGVGGEVIQIATGVEHTVGEVAEILANLIRHKAGRAVSVEYQDLRPGEMHRNYADVSKARRMLKFVPKVELADGLGRTLDYFLKTANKAVPVGTT